MGQKFPTEGASAQMNNPKSISIIMKKILFALAALLLPLAGMAKEKVEQPVKVRWCTFNVRCIAAPDEKIGCSWEVQIGRAHV